MNRLINLALMMCFTGFTTSVTAGNVVTPVDNNSPPCSTNQNPNIPCSGNARNPGTKVTPGTGIARPPAPDPDTTANQATITPGTGANIKPDVGIPDTTQIGSEPYEGDKAQQTTPTAPVKRSARRVGWRELY